MGEQILNLIESLLIVALILGGTWLAADHTMFNGAGTVGAIAIVLGVLWAFD
jgi:hypothetical protein